MKKSLLTTGFLVSAILVSAQSFEGIIEVATYSKATQDAAVVKWFTKGGSNKMEITGTSEGKAYTTVLLFKTNDEQLYILTEIEGRKAVYTVPQSSIAESSKFSNAAVAKTEGKKSIAGYDCYQVKIETREETALCWVSDAIGLGAENFPPSLRSKGVLGILKSSGISGIPLEVTSTNAAGETTFSFQVKTIKPQALSESFFDIPPDFQKGEELLKKSVKVE
ncbi:MAG TPA: DUF4412 domain-containing protein [Chitinophagales bacterium]|nr:DUF4412 domain-containing protein [Chitinophagales bacterium]